MRRIPLAIAAAALTLLQPAAWAQTVQLIEAGSSPRQALRYRFESGRSERIAMHTELTMSVSMGGQQMPMNAVPPINMVMSLRVSEVRADGSARLEFEMVDARADAADSQAAAQIGEALETVQGIKGWYLMDTQGRITGGGVTPAGGDAAAAGDLASNFRESMQQLAAPFPVEAVGKGARWRLQQNTETGGMRISQTAEYTLRSLEGRRIALDVRIVDSKVESSAALPAGAKLDAVKIEGGGSSSLDLDKIVPTALLDIATHIGMSMETPGEAQSVAMELTIKQSVAPEG